MCFSAFASFFSGAVIGLYGLILLFINFRCEDVGSWYYGRKWVPDWSQSDHYENTKWYWFPFVLTPFLFGTQQILEGFVWLRLDQDPDAQAGFAAYGFAFFAFAFWPFWNAFACCLMEYNLFRLEDIGVISERAKSNRKAWWVLRMKGLATCVLVGLFLMVYVCISFDQNMISTSVSCNNHIRYDIRLLQKEHFWYYYVYTSTYLCTGLAPFMLVRSVDKMWLMTVAVGAAALISHFLYQGDSTFPSTWCLFSAWLSMIIGIYRVRDLNKIFSNFQAELDTNVRSTDSSAVASEPLTTDALRALSQSVEVV